jgi:RND family efflux transporter MFP subunit
MDKKIIITITVILIILIAIVVKLAGNKKEINTRSEVKTTENKVSVTVATAELKETGGLLQLVGKAEPYREVTVASETSGKIVELDFKMGDFVSKGAVLTKVDDTYKRLACETAQINHDKFKEDYEKFQVLRQGDAVTDNQLRDMRIGYEMAVIQLENAKKQLDDTKITAPFSGYITSKITELGAFVNMGTPVAGIADISLLKVQLMVSESDVYQLHTGMEAQIFTDVLPDIRFKANISGIGQRGTSAHTYPVEIIITNHPQNPLKAGTYVNVSITTGDTGKKLMIPRDAIVSSVKDPAVYRIEGTIAKLVKITTGKDYENNIEVLQGVQEGDQVVVNGQINLMDGASVILNF